MNPKIIYLSPPADVSMADLWFKTARLDHFWIQRRFEVFKCLTGKVVANARELAEIGCGHGLLQRQIEDMYGRKVTGFDLNQNALRQNLSGSPVFCYDICQTKSELKQRFDLIVMCDVLEHIDDEDGFLAATVFHLAPGGALVVNVPAGQWAYSAYDQAVGHKRRYSISSLKAVVERNNLQVENWSYWGFPLVPVLMLRKAWVRRAYDENKIISAGFDSRTSAVNRCLRLLSRCEPIPQKLLGTSLMAVLRVKSD